MAKFSVNYAGIANTESRLHQLYQRIDDVSHDVYAAANKTSGAKSLENKGYVRALRERGLAIQDQASEINVQGKGLADIGLAYSQTERRVLDLLSGVVARGGCSSESAAIVSDALAAHRLYQRNDNAKRTLEESVFEPARNLQGTIESFRYWRSTKGSKMVKDFLKKVGDKDGNVETLSHDVIKDINKKIEGFEDVLGAVLNPTNPDAIKKGGEALSGMMGLGGFTSMFGRYATMTDAISKRTSEIAAQGDTGRAVCYALSATTLATFQFAGDGIYNTGKYLLKNIKFKGPGKSESVETGLLEDYMAKFGDWCWSRLDSAYGV